MKKRSIDTQLIHAGEPDPRFEGAVAMPIFQSAMFEYGGPHDEVRYVRYSNNPNQLVLQEKLATLEGAEDAVVASSGMAAISSALLSVLRPGDHVLAQNCLYGGTHNLLTSFLNGLGIQFDFIDASAPDSWEHALRRNTKVIYVETITNPLIEVCDLGAVTRFAKDHDIVSMIDNTFASPVNFRPSEWDFDVSLYSATKYLNGHSDLVAGAAVGRKHLIGGVRDTIVRLGGSLDPHACFLLHRGLKTLALRVARQNESALRLARMLREHPAVRRVNYAGLDNSPSHQNAQSYLDGFGGMLSFEADGDPTVFMSALEIPILAPSLGGVETLVVLPAQTSHAGLTPEERRMIGVTDSLIRVSVGIESADDLIADFHHALASLTHVVH